MEKNTPAKMSDPAANPRFPTTQWTLLHWLRSPDAEQSELALERLCATYHGPLWHFGRSCGLSPHDAEDAVQDFFLTVLGKQSLATLRQEKGRLRGWMKAVFLNKLRHHRDQKTARKRGGGAVHLSLDLPEAEFLYDQLQQRTLDPALTYDLSLSWQLWKETLARLDANPKIQKRPDIYAVLRPCLPQGWPKTGLTQAEAAARLNLSANTLKVRLNNLIAKARTAFGETARETMDPSVPDDDLEYLWRLLQ